MDAKEREFTIVAETHTTEGSGPAIIALEVSSIEPRKI